MVKLNIYHNLNLSINGPTIKNIDEELDSNLETDSFNLIQRYSFNSYNHILNTSNFSNYTQQEYSPNNFLIPSIV